MAGADVSPGRVQINGGAASTAGSVQTGGEPTFGVTRGDG
jgi:hypothetical protein